mgnify:CR=1 FL=1
MVTYTQTFFYCNFPQFYFFFLYIFRRKTAFFPSAFLRFFVSVQSHAKRKKNRKQEKDGKFRKYR